jgi:hypothetical protein
MAQNNSSDDWVGPVIGNILLWLWLILAGAWVISKWLTEVLIEHVVNPLLHFALDRNDGLVVLLAGGLWSLVFGGLFWSASRSASPPAPPQEAAHALLAGLGLGLAWGISIGFWILLTWWSAVELTPAYEPVQLLGEPIQVVSRQPADGQQSLLSSSLPSRSELEADLAEIFGQEEVLQGASLG